MVRRNLETDVPFVCFTDLPGRPCPGIRYERLPADRPGWWSKLGLFRPEVRGIDSRWMLYLDLDVVITGGIKPLLHLKGDLCIARDYPVLTHPQRPDCNTSVMLIKVGANPDIWESYEAMANAELRYWSDQDFLNSLYPGRIELIPDDWVQSYKLHGLKEGYPPGCRIVMFHGKPKPHECVGWVKDLWRVT